MSCVSQSITRYSLIRCIVSSAQFARGYLCFYDEYAELLAQDAAGETTTPLRIDYDAILHFRVVRQEQLMRIEIPHRVVLRWAEANGFAAEISDGETNALPPDGPCALIEQLSAEDMAHFLQCIAPVVAASRRTRSLSRVSTTEPLPLSYFPPSPQANIAAETEEEPNQEEEEEEEEEEQEKEIGEEEEDEEHEQRSGEGGSGKKGGVADEESGEDADGKRDEVADEKSERLSRCLERIASDRAVHFARGNATQQCSASSSASFSSVRSDARRRQPRKREAAGTKRPRIFVGATSDGGATPKKQSKSKNDVTHITASPLTLSNAESQMTALLRNAESQITALLPNAESQITAPLRNAESQITAPLPKAESQITALLPNAESQITAPLPKAESRNTAPLPKAESKITAPLPKAQPQSTAPLPKAQPQSTAPLPKAQPQSTASLPNAQPQSTASLPNAQHQRTRSQAKAKPKLVSVPTGNANAEYNFADVMTAPENAAVLRPSGEEVKKMLVDLEEILPCKRRTGTVGKARRTQAKKSVKVPMPIVSAHTTDESRVVNSTDAAEVTQKKESDAAEVIRKKKPDAAEVTQKKESDAAEVTRKKESDAAEVTRKKESDAAEVTRKKESDAAEVTRKKEFDAAGVIRKKKPDAAEVTRKKESDAAEITRKKEFDAAEVTRPEESDAAVVTCTEESDAAGVNQKKESDAAEVIRTEKPAAAEIARAEDSADAPAEEPTTPLLDTRAFYDSRKAAAAAERQKARKAKKSARGKRSKAVPIAAPLRATSECPAAAPLKARAPTPLSSPSSSTLRYGCAHCGGAAAGLVVGDRRKERWRRVVRYLDGLAAHLTRARTCGEELRGLFLVMLEDAEV